MQALDPIETVLARLMPQALSQSCSEELEEQIDDLAAHAPTHVVEISSGKWLVRCLVGGGIAAAIGALIAIFPTSPSPVDKGAQVQSAAAFDPDLVLVKRAQLEEAIRRSKPGEEIVISGIRDGKPLEMRMKFGNDSNSQTQPPDEIVEPTIPREPRPRMDPLAPVKP